MIALRLPLLLLLVVTPAGAQGRAAHLAKSLGASTAADSVLRVRSASTRVSVRTADDSRATRILLFTDGSDVLVLILPQINECDETRRSLAFLPRHARVVVRY